MIEFIVLLVLIGVALLYGTANREGYQNPSSDGQPIPYLSACPGQMTTFYLPDGRPACCDGALTDGQCRYQSKCVMTGPGTPDVPNCTDIQNKNYQRKGNRLCPPSMGTYFEDPSTKKKGCTDGILDTNYHRPAQPTQPTCWIYPTMEENLDKSDSCAIQKDLEEAQCFGRGCKKMISPSNPPLVTIQFQDDMGMYRTAYTRKSALHFLNKTQPNWRGSIDLDKNSNVAEVAKAFYVDKTLSSNQIQM